MVPHWSDGPDSQYSTINARAETAHDKPAYRGPFRSKRCGVVATGFYEWRENLDGNKTPMHVCREDSGLFLFAGLRDEWTAEDEEQVVRSCTILTIEPNDLMAPIHDRMPVVLDRSDRGWLTRWSRTWTDYRNCWRPGRPTRGRRTRCPHG